MADKTIKPWQRALAYSGFGLFALVAAFFITFPYEALRERIRNEADAAGYFVRIGSLGPGLFAVRATSEHGTGALLNQTHRELGGAAPAGHPMAGDVADPAGPSAGDDVVQRDLGHEPVAAEASEVRRAIVRAVPPELERRHGAEGTEGG